MDKAFGVKIKFVDKIINWLKRLLETDRIFTGRP